MTLAVNIAQGGSNNVTFRNRIINGGMAIDQRNAGASVTPTSDNTYTLDRWTAKLSQSSKYSVQQSSTAATGFKNSLLITSLSAYTVGASETFFIKQVIEGFNVADLGWGAAGASTVTLSFWVRSSLTGTFGGSLWNSAGDRSYPFSYTISSANTWTQISITIAGDTSGTWLTTNGSGINVGFAFGVGTSLSTTAGAWTAGFYPSATGATSVVGTNGATWYITGVQLEAGTTASPFEYRQYGTELALCQRYFEKSYSDGAVPGSIDNSGCIAAVCYNTSANRPFLNCPFKVTKRTTPTVTPYNPNSGASGQMNGPSNAAITSTVYYAGTQATNFYAAVGAGVSNGDYYQQWTASAEL